MRSTCPGPMTMEKLTEYVCVTRPGMRSQPMTILCFMQGLCLMTECSHSVNRLRCFDRNHQFALCVSGDRCPCRRKNVLIFFKNCMCPICAATQSFDDDEGAEMDIANGYGIIRAIQSAHSVRPVVLLSRHDFHNKMVLGIDEMGALYCKRCSIRFQNSNSCRPAATKLIHLMWGCFFHL